MFCRAIALPLQPDTIAFVGDKNNDTKERRMLLKKGEKECEGRRIKDWYLMRKW